MAVIHWWLLQLTEVEQDDFRIRYMENFSSGSLYEEAYDQAGIDILAEKGVVPGTVFEWPKPNWADAETEKFNATH